MARLSLNTCQHITDQSFKLSIELQYKYFGQLWHTVISLNCHIITKIDQRLCAASEWC